MANASLKVFGGFIQLDICLVGEKQDGHIL